MPSDSCTALSPNLPPMQTTSTSSPKFAPMPHDWVLAGTSAAIRQLRSQIQRIAPYYRVALVRGEAGTGKERIARAIHSMSPAAEGPFVAIYAQTLAEAAATGDDSREKLAPAAVLLLDSARGGTLYLEDVGELSHAMQASLLHVLRCCEDRRTSRPVLSYDGQERRRHDTSGGSIRILASSRRDLGALSAVGQFRQDLHASLTAVEIVVPSLRQRLGDIAELANALLRRFAEHRDDRPKLLAEQTVAQLQEQAWPDNLPEFSNVVLRAAALSDGTLIEPRHLLALVSGVTTPTSPRLERLHVVVQRHVFEVLTCCGGNKRRAAELLGISRSTLYRMLDAGLPEPTQE